jgi:hypothetical protein
MSSGIAGSGIRLSGIDCAAIGAETNGADIEAIEPVGWKTTFCCWLLD